MRRAEGPGLRGKGWKGQRLKRKRSQRCTLHALKMDEVYTGMFLKKAQQEANREGRAARHFFSFRVATPMHA